MLYLGMRRFTQTLIYKIYCCILGYCYFIDFCVLGKATFGGHITNAQNFKDAMYNNYFIHSFKTLCSVVSHALK